MPTPGKDRHGDDDTTAATSRHALVARAARRQSAEAIGVDAAFVSRLVDRFYARVRADPLIGPIFDAQISDWEPHLDQMKRFWRSVLFSSGEYFGNPMAKHVALENLGRDHFVRWLELFRETLDEIGSPPARELVHAKARMIATSLLNGIVIHREGGIGLPRSDAF